MSWIRRWWGGFVTPEPRHSARVPYPRPTFPILVFDEDPTDKTEVAVPPPVYAVEVSDPSIGPAPRFQPPRPAVDSARVRAVIVRVTADEWVRLGREAQRGQDMGDVLRGWAGLPEIRRRRV